MMLNETRLQPGTFVNFLQKNHTKIHFFGLGFIQVKMNDDSRYHFYHPELEAFTENPHDHRYHFTSTVLRGTLGNRIWKICAPDEPGVAGTLRYESCNVEDKAPSYTLPIEMMEVATFQVSEGSSYYLDENSYHQVRRIGDGPCVTHLRRGPKVKLLASVLSPEGKEDVCPFSRNLDEKELWDIVRDSLL